MGSGGDWWELRKTEFRNQDDDGSAGVCVYI